MNPVTVEGVTYDLSFDRRRYGGRQGTTYTWVYARPQTTDEDGDWTSLGDPWPVLMPKKIEVVDMIERLFHCPEKPGPALRFQPQGVEA